MIKTRNLTIALVALSACGTQPQQEDVANPKLESSSVEADAVSVSSESVKDLKEEPAQEEGAKRDAPETALKILTSVSESKPKTVAETGRLEAKDPPSPEPVAKVKKVAMVEPSSIAQCKICHSFKAGQKSSFGPNLFGIVGKKAGSQPGFGYSQVIKEANIQWDRATLNRFIEAPQSAIPGNNMAFSGIKNSSKRAEIIDYLATLE